MSKKIVYFNASKQMETITVHYNDKLDGAFVNDVMGSINDIAKKMGRKVDLKNPTDYYTIQVFVYPSKSLFNQIFGGEIERRFYARRRSLEDMYVVKDSDGNIHIVSPRGMGSEKTDSLKKILVMKVLGEYMPEKEKKSAERLLKAALKPKEEEKEEPIEEKEEPNDEKEYEQEEELTEEELDEIIETEQEIEEIDEKQEDNEFNEDNEENEVVEDKEDQESSRPVKKSTEQQWLNYGWLAYVRGKLKKEKDITEFAKHISKKGIKKLKGLSNSKLFEEYNYSIEYACATVDYIVTTYGMKKFVEYYENPKDLEKIFGTTKYRFNANLKAYVYSKYNMNEMKMEMDQKDLPEITEIKFTKSGGADITESTENIEIEKTKEIN